MNDAHRDTPITELSLEQQLERMTSQRNALALLIDNFRLSFGTDGITESSPCSEELKLELEDLETSLKSTLGLVQKLRGKLRRIDRDYGELADSLNAQMQEVVGTPFCTEGYNFFTEDDNPNGPERPKESS